MDPTGATSAARFLPRSSEIAAAHGPGPLRHVASTGSTNVDLAAEARGGDSGGAVLVADHQTAGRGRRDRAWDDVAGRALLVSVRVPCGPDRAAAVTRAVGAAARAAADEVCAVPVLAKWPNDLVVLEGKAPGKLAGQLAEFVTGEQPCVVVGVGLNLRPVEGHDDATSVVECGGPDDRDALLAALLRGLSSRLADDERAVLDELRRHSATIGRRVRAELPGDTDVIGLALDLTDDGELVVRDDGGVRHVVGVGDVIHLRPA
jgi:BirA family biotin operon repressor/biotin-[acetyl-CoA-carboxylase] ligase